MKTDNISKPYILTVNAGSSSIKLAAFTAQPLQKQFEVAVENLGQPSASLVTPDGRTPLTISDHTDAASALLQWLSLQIARADVAAVGHRIVHGGPKYSRATGVTNALLDDLHELAVFDPEHLPAELKLIGIFQRFLPSAQQVACFDTAFHHNLPMRSQLVPLPRRLANQGVRRYGFHGLSYAYIVEELRRVEGDAAAHGKVIVAHLGSGASLAALEDGRPIDTTMSMTPTSGIPMSTRSGDLDPGLMFYLASTQRYSAEQLHHMVNFESGLLGISETSADMKQLLASEKTDARAKDAIDIFCYNVTKTIGSYAAALGGLHTLVFTGGMGENAPKIRTRICTSLAFLGVQLDDVRNQASERLISVAGAPVGVHVIHTDEAVTIARETFTITTENGEH